METLANVVGAIVASISWLKEWQTLAGAGLGFGSIIFTLWYNARQERRRYKAERQSYLSAIRAELENYQDELASMVKPVGEEGQATLHVPPKLVDPIIYTANLGKVGLLGPDTAHAVIKAYETVAKYEEHMGYLLESLGRHLPLQRLGSGNYALPPVFEPQVARIARHTAHAIRLATSRLDDQLARMK